MVVITFVLEKDIDVAVQEVRDRINQIAYELPKDVETPLVQKFDPDSVPVVILAVQAQRPVREITEYADRVLRRRLETVPGVGQVSIIGGRKRQARMRFHRRERRQRVHVYEAIADRDGKIVTAMLAFLAHESRHPPHGRVIEQQRLDD